MRIRVSFSDLKKRLLTAAVLLALTTLAVARPADKGNLAEDPRVRDAVKAWEEWVEYQAAVNRVPGLSVGIVHNQELIAEKGFGFANPAQSKPATPETVYSICSISKLFTSIAVMQQRDAGNLRLDDPVRQHLSWFNLEDVHPDDAPITVRGLLTHSAGLPRESDFPYWTGMDFPFPTREQIRARLVEQQTLYPSSRFFQYSNLGLTLAGEIVVAASEEPFDEYIRRHILDPLQMESTFTEVPTELHGDRLAVGFSALKRDGGRQELPPFQAQGIAPAAGFASSVRDLARFARWQNRLLSEGGEEVLKASTLREMQRVHWVDPDWETTWGLGFVVRKRGDHSVVGHGGACPGYFSRFLLDTREKVAAIVLSNAIGADVGLYAEKSLDLIVPAIQKAKGDPEGAPRRDPELDRYTGIYETVWGQIAILRWEDGLAALGLGARDPKEALVQLEKVDEHTFRRVREDGDVPGEEFLFDVAPDGAATRFKRHSNWYVKVREIE